MLVILFESTLNSFSPVTIGQELCSISMATDEIPLMSVTTDLLSNLFLNILNILTVKAACWDGTEMNSSSFKHAKASNNQMSFTHNSKEEQYKKET